jgi:hypothetical protein
MAHDHSHDDPKAYYVEQLCTIGIAGALGGIAVMLDRSGALWFLIPPFRTMVMAGGVGLLVLVVIRAAVVWMQAGRVGANGHAHAHDHDHDHAHEHGHEHEHEHCHGAGCDHDHEHAHAHGNGHSHGEGDDGHSHGSAPWRYVILLLPVALYFLGLPNAAMQAAVDTDVAGFKASDVQVRDLAAQETGQAFAVSFKELERAPYTAEGRKTYEGKTIRLVGQYLSGPNDKMCTLVRYKMSCCAADAVALNAIIVIDEKSDAKFSPDLRGKWVSVEGQVQFQRRPDRPDAWMTIIVLRPTAEHPITELIKVVKPDSSYFLY